MLRIAALFGLAVILQGQTRFQVFNTENGLPNNSVLAIRQTRDGYLWFTTYRGLVRFDGVHFQVFDPSNTPALRGTNFAAFSLFEDNQGVLWAGTWSSGAIRYQNGKFSALTKHEGLPSNTVVRIDQSNDGTIWMFHNPGLSRMRNGHVEVVRTIDGEDIARFQKPPPDLGVDPYLFGLWRSTSTGLQRFAYGSWQSVPVPKVSAIDKAGFDFLLEDAQGRLWFTLFGSTGNAYCVKSQQLTSYSGLPPGAFITYQDRFGRLWLSDHQGRTGLWHKGIFTPTKEISTTYPFRVLEDREGTFWVGTLERGLAHGMLNAVATVHLPGGPEVNRIQPIAADPGGNLWVGSLGLTKVVLGSPGELPRRFIRMDPGTAERSRRLVTAILIEPNDSVLCGHSRGLSIFKDGHYRDPEPPLRTIQSEVNALLRDRAGDLWVGTEEGVYRYRDRQLTFFNASNSPIKGDVRALYEEPDGALWIGTDVGLCKTENLKFSCFGPQDDISQWGVLSITSDADHVIWAGTSKKGILRVSRNGLTTIGAEQGLTTNDASAIVEDAHGYFWIGSQLGIYRVKRDNLDNLAGGRISRVTSTSFGTYDGLMSAKCTGQGQPHSVRMRDGTIWFPTDEGLARIDERTIPFDSKPPPVTIETCSLDLRTIGCEKEITLSPDAKNFEIHYSAPSLIRSNQINFRYRIAGLDDKWVDAGRRRTAYFSRLPHGTFRFQVIAANSDGIWNQTGKQLSITVQPHLYQTLWFQLLAGTLVLGSFWAAWRVRALRFDREQAARQAFAHQVIASQELERKRIASELHDGLGQHLAIIRNMALMQTQSDQKNANQNVDDIAHEAAMAISEVREISHNLRPYQLDLLGLTKSVEELVTRTFVNSGSKLEINIDNVDDVFPKDLQIHFYRILQEAISNTVKHSQASAISILIGRSEDSVDLVMKDNGIGFTSGDFSSTIAERGFGLTSMRERAQLLNGLVHIRSSPGAGTIISIHFVLKTADA